MSKEVLELVRKAKNWVGMSVEVYVSEVGYVDAIVEIGSYGVPKLRMTGKGVDAVWCMASSSITGKGSRKHGNVLASTARKVIESFQTVADDVAEEVAELDRIKALPLREKAIMLIELAKRHRSLSNDFNDAELTGNQRQKSEARADMDVIMLRAETILGRKPMPHEWDEWARFKRDLLDFNDIMNVIASGGGK